MAFRMRLDVSHIVNSIVYGQELNALVRGAVIVDTDKIVSGIKRVNTFEAACRHFVESLDTLHTFDVI